MKYKVYSKQFKLDALNLVKKKGYAATARDLGISKSSLRYWAKQYNFSQQANGYQTQSIADVMDRNRELEKENRKLKETVEVLKDATAFFCLEKQK